VSRIGEWAQKRWDARSATDVDDDPAFEFDGQVTRLSEVSPRADAKREELLSALRALGADDDVLRLVEEFEGVVGVQGMLLGSRIWR
jgi:hypothetical protein